MRRNVTAAVVQLLGLALILVGAFWWSVPAGVVACGAVLMLLGIDLEDDR